MVPTCADGQASSHHESFTMGNTPKIITNRCVSAPYHVHNRIAQFVVRSSDHFLLSSHNAHHLCHLSGTYLWPSDPSLQSDYLCRFLSLISLISV